MNAQDKGKHAAAVAAVRLIETGMVLGLGSGSTMVFVVQEIARRMREEGLRITGVPTSERTASLARELGVPLAALEDTAGLDLAIDGADEVVTGSLDLIKGLGGALLREKIVQQAAKRFVVVADASKIVDRLGVKSPLPVEVVPFAHAATARRIAGLGVTPMLRGGAVKPFVTDNGNLIYDCGGLASLDSAGELSLALHAIAGVVETGLFLGCTERAIIGREDGGIDELLPG